jgi:hypothetical protein
VSASPSLRLAKGLGFGGQFLRQYYDSLGKSLASVVFSNGPMMYPPDKGLSTTWQSALRIGLVTISGALAGALSGALIGGLIGALVGFLIGGLAGFSFHFLGGAIGAVVAGKHTTGPSTKCFCDSEPYGYVFGAKNHVDDRRATAIPPFTTWVVRIGRFQLMASHSVIRPELHWGHLRINPSGTKPSGHEQFTHYRFGGAESAISQGLCNVSG